jgi:hypothetical protein
MHEFKKADPVEEKNGVCFHRQHQLFMHFWIQFLKSLPLKKHRF